MQNTCGLRLGVHNRSSEGQYALKACFWERGWRSRDLLLLLYRLMQLR